MKKIPTLFARTFEGHKVVDITDEITPSLKQGNQIILEPEDWTKDQWATILELFGMEEAERIVLSEYVIDAYGTPIVYGGG